MVRNAGVDRRPGAAVRRPAFPPQVKTFNVIVIGASSGGLEALSSPVAQLPKDLPAPVFIVRHMAADGHAKVLGDVLHKAGPLPCRVARHGEAIVPGRIYIP